MHDSASGINNLKLFDLVKKYKHFSQKPKGHYSFSRTKEITAAGHEQVMMSGKHFD